jgi:hypothetical protein
MTSGAGKSSGLLMMKTSKPLSSNQRSRNGFIYDGSDSECSTGSEEEEDEDSDEGEEDSSSAREPSPKRQRTSVRSSLDESQMHPRGGGGELVPMRLRLRPGRLPRAGATGPDGRSGRPARHSASERPHAQAQSRHVPPRTSADSATDGL